MFTTRTDETAVLPAELPERLHVHTTATATRRILVAEDNAGMLQMIARALRRDGHEVVGARNGFELMQWIELLTQWSQPVPLFDAIVTDLRMPQYSGQECLEYLKLCGLATPVILITAFGDDLVHRQAMASGARAVLDKPLPMSELRAAVHRAIR